MSTETNPAAVGRILIDRDAVMAKLGISDRRTIYRLIEEEGLPVKRITERIIRFDAAEVDAWIDSRCTSPAPGQVA